MDINELTQKVANHLAQRPVTIKWQNPPSESAAGQICKSADGQLIIYVGNLTSADARLAVLCHELAHARSDPDFVPVSNDHKRQPGSIKRSPEARKIWRAHPREKRAQEMADEWLRYADKHAHEFWRAGRDRMTCRLLALLDWRK